MKYSFLISLLPLFISCVKTERATTEISRDSVSRQKCPSLFVELRRLPLRQNMIDQVDWKDGSLIKLEGLYLERISSALGSTNIYLYSGSVLSDCSVVVYQRDEFDEVREKVIFVTLNSQGNPIDFISLAERLPYPDGIQVITSEVNDSTITQTRFLEMAGEYDKARDTNLSVIDSVVTIAHIYSDGKIKRTRKDSVRIVR